jgi:hypothetical protein
MKEEFKFFVYRMSLLIALSKFLYHIYSFIYARNEGAEIFFNQVIYLLLLFHCYILFKSSKQRVE